MSGPLVLALESSCDETGLAIVEGGRRIHANVVASQVALHAATGGIVPEVAARAHLRWIVPVMDEAWAAAGVTWDDIDAVTVTYGPGLAGSLLVGVNFAKALAWVHDKPLVGVNHLEGHVYASWLLDPDEPEHAEPAFPLVALVVSGGHTFLAEMRDHLTYRLLGQTVDDAAGEAFDKVGSLLGLGYPAGAQVERLAREGRSGRFDFPRPMLREGYAFSFSGLKTAVLTRLRDTDKTDPKVRADAAASFEAAIVDVLAAKCMQALEREGLERLVVAGGVGANTRLRSRLIGEAQERGGRVFFPPLRLCTDNGAMIAFAAALKYPQGDAGDAAFPVFPRWDLAAAAQSTPRR